MNNKIYEYVGTSPQLKNAVVTIDRETNKSYYINYRPMGGGRRRNPQGIQNQP